MSTDREQRSRRTRGDVRDHYDVVVVGAGLGGLVAASLIARTGRSVLCLDKHYVPGGNATLFRRREWEFDVGLHYVGDCGPGGTLPSILQACGVDDVVFRPMDTDLESVWIGDEKFVIPSSRPAFRRSLIERFPTERAGIRRYIRFLDQLARVTRATQSGGRAEQALALLRAPLVVRWAHRTFGEFLDSCTQHRTLRALICAQHGTYAIAPGRVSAVLHGGLQNHYFESGGWYPEGGGQRMSDRLAEALEAAGGDLRLRCEATRIHVEGGRATGVSFASKHLGERRISADHVVCNADLKRAVDELIGAEHIEPSWAKRVQQGDMALPLFVVFLGVDIPPAELPYGNGNVWLADRLDADAEYAALRRGEMMMPPPIYVSTASLKDPHNPRIAPEGHSNIEVMTMVPAAPSYWGVTDEQIRDGSYAEQPAYQARKKELEDACIAQFARIVPGLEAHIVFRESATPMTHTRYVGSTDGTSYGLAATPAQFLERRPHAKGAKVQGLTFCGASLQAGHGIVGSMISGLQAAEYVLETKMTRQVLGGRRAA